MSDAVKDLINLLDLEKLEVNLFRGVSPQNGWKRVFGGQVIAQALVASNRTVDPIRQVHSLHAYFILGGDPAVPIVYEVDRVRDGKSFSTRRVLAIQHGEAIFALIASYHIAEEGVGEHQMQMPNVPLPDDLPSEKDLSKMMPNVPPQVTAYYQRERPIELRPVEFGRYLGQKQKDGKFNLWLRAKAPLGDDPSLHQAVLAYASDMSLLDSALVPHGQTLFQSTVQAASLDHAIWFHREFRADEWILFAQDSPSMTGARGFTRGQFFKADGTLIASVAQEGLLRVMKNKV